MHQSQEETKLEPLLDRLREAGQESDRVKLRRMIEVVGRRSFGPLLLVAGLIALSPLSAIPGMPTMVGLIVLLIAGQLLIGRDHFWLPRWLLERSISQKSFEKGLKFLQKPARWIDHLLRPRLKALTKGAALYVIAAWCVLIALTMPSMEFLPFSASAIGAALTALGLSIIAHDGLFALVAIAITAAAAGLVLSQLF